MTVMVTLHIFSGRENPSWELTRDQAAELKETLRNIWKPSILKPPGVMTGLGYTGFTIRTISEFGLAAAMYVHRGIIDANLTGPSLETGTGDLEHWLLRTGSALSPAISMYVSKEISAVDYHDPKRGLADIHFALAVAPQFDAQKWNNDTTRPINNCYNYATDIVTDHFAEPGRGVGKPVRIPYSCQDLIRASRNDGLESVDKKTALSKTEPVVGHYAALVYTDWYNYEYPNSDYHWYRRDKGGTWSHKPGALMCRNVDGHNKQILDPQTCDRHPYDGDKYFCGYFHVIPGKVQVA